MAPEAQAGQARRRPTRETGRQEDRTAYGVASSPSRMVQYDCSPNNRQPLRFQAPGWGGANPAAAPSISRSDRYMLTPAQQRAVSQSEQRSVSREQSVRASMSRSGGAGSRLHSRERYRGGEKVSKSRTDKLFADLQM